MTPILTSTGDYVRTIPKGTRVAFVYNGEMRGGHVERGDHRSTLTLHTVTGYRQFTRTKIEEMSIYA